MLIYEMIIFLDAVLPPDIPIPNIAEVQRALYDATKSH